MDVAVVAVIASSVVGLAGVLTPALSRRADRQHERAAAIREQRAQAYRQTLAMLFHISDDDHDAAKAASRESSVSVWLWGSKEVRDLLVKWLDAHPTTRGPAATAAHREKVGLAATALKLRMSDELQGRVPLD